MVCTRPDISHAINMVSRYLSCPDKQHLEAIKWILRFLKDTAYSCLEFGKSDTKLTGYVDSDFIGDFDKRLSLTGYVFTLGGSTSSYKAILQFVIALSTTEAKYMALPKGIK